MLILAHVRAKRSSDDGTKKQNRFISHATGGGAGTGGGELLVGFSRGARQHPQREPGTGVQRRGRTWTAQTSHPPVDSLCRGARLPAGIGPARGGERHSGPARHSGFAGSG
jgi:hypothetical protein